MHFKGNIITIYFMYCESTPTITKVNTVCIRCLNKMSLSKALNPQLQCNRTWKPRQPLHRMHAIWFYLQVCICILWKLKTFLERLIMYAFFSFHSVYVLWGDSLWNKWKGLYIYTNILLWQDRRSPLCPDHVSKQSQQILVLPWIVMCSNM